MAHNMKVEIRPHKNKDGSESKTKKDYVVIDRPRKGCQIEVGVVSSQKAADSLIDVTRKMLHTNHMRKNPNDKHFLRKHGYKPFKETAK